MSAPSGRVVVVTGAGRGIGRAVAADLVAGGDDVTLAARSLDEVGAVAAELTSAGGRAHAVVCDVTDEAQVATLVEGAAARGGGRIDVLVCCAGVAHVAPFTELSRQQWDESLGSTLTGTFLCCRAAVGHMGAGGLIVVLSSIAGRTGFPGWSAYSAAKFGLQGFSEAIRAELRPRGIRVTSVLSGAVDTALWAGVPGEWDRSGMLVAADVARAVRHVVDQPAHVSVDEVVIGHVVGAL